MDKTVPAGAARLLDFIASLEAPRGYNTIFGNHDVSLGRPITSMTINDLLAAQSGWGDKWGSSAAGRYQIIRKTLQGLRDKLKLTGNETYSPDLQDRLAFHLLRERGYDQFMAGKMSTLDFATGVSREWASVPVLVEMRGAHGIVKRGDSYYHGDTKNKALTRADTFEAILRKIKLEGDGGKPVVPAAALPEAKPTPVQAQRGRLTLLATLLIVVVVVVAAYLIFLR